MPISSRKGGGEAEKCKIGNEIFSTLAFQDSSELLVNMVSYFNNLLNLFQVSCGKMALTNLFLVNWFPKKMSKFFVFCISCFYCASFFLDFLSKFRIVFAPFCQTFTNFDKNNLQNIPPEYTNAPFQPKKIPK